MLVQGDKHNFGQVVALREYSTRPMFCKPRTIYWEKLFYGQNSELVGSFDFQISNSDVSFGFRNSNFNLGIIGEDLSVEGWSVPIEEEINPHFPYDLQLGALLAYNHMFGIFDLHLDNLKFTRSGIQVIDCEVVFSDMILPNESLLLPFKNYPEQLTALSRIKKMHGIDSTWRENIILGYYQMASHFCEKAQEITSILNGLNLEEVPIRVILRDSRKYLGIIPNDYNDKPLIEEEELQMKRGDVPYFFKTIKDSQLKYFNNSLRQSSQVDSYSSFEKEVKRVGLGFRTLLDQSRLYRQRVAGILFLANSFFKEEQFLIQNQGLELQGDHDFIHLKCDTKTFSTKRIRNELQKKK